MVKRLSLMAKLFTRQRFGRPQFFAGTLLMAFLAQALWLVYADFHEADLHAADRKAADRHENDLHENDSQNSIEPNSSELVRIVSGWRQLKGGAIAGAPFPDPPGTLPSEVPADAANFNTEHSPLLSIVTAAPLLAWPRDLHPSKPLTWRWLPRLPFLAFGAFLGASLWYVARRLCGQTGGFFALTLFCFSPSMLQASAVWHTEPQILAAWGSFGAIFTAIAVSHTLYAPREVVLWNWRRIVLLGISLAIAIGSQFSMIVVIPCALAFMLYLAPIRRGAAIVIWAAACAVALLLLFAIYFFRLHIFLEAMHHASFLDIDWRGFTAPLSYRHAMSQMLRGCPAFAFLLPAALIAYAAWPRARYFGNTAPLLIASLFIGLGIAQPNAPSSGFLLASIPFALIFVAGVLADLMESSASPLPSACVWALVGADILYCLLALVKIPATP